jgi:hypothetical protein
MRLKTGCIIDGRPASTDRIAYSELAKLLRGKKSGEQVVDASELKYVTTVFKFHLSYKAFPDGIVKQVVVDRDEADRGIRRRGFRLYGIGGVTAFMYPTSIGGIEAHIESTILHTERFYRVKSGVNVARRIDEFLRNEGLTVFDLNLDYGRIAVGGEQGQRKQAAWDEWWKGVGEKG